VEIPVGNPDLAESSAAIILAGWNGFNGFVPHPDALGWVVVGEKSGGQSRIAF